jgi:transcriptional regulator with XRE-family HTH domain
MNYEDQLKNLLDQIRREREEEHNLPKQVPPIFDDPNDLVSFLRNHPIVSHVEVTTLSSFLRRFRRGLGIKIEDVANALELEPQDLENLESIDCLPWKISARSIAKILSAYRIHVSALKFLTENSYQIARVSGRISDPNDAEEVISTWLSDVASTLRTLGEQSLIS